MQGEVGVSDGELLPPGDPSPGPHHHPLPLHPVLQAGGQDANLPHVMATWLLNNHICKMKQVCPVDIASAAPLTTIVLYFNTLYCIVLYYIVFYCFALLCIALYCVILYLIV